MKKQLLALAILGSGLANAQAWTQDFSTPTPPALPAGWMQNNVDGNTVVTNLASWNFGTNAWVSWNFTGDPHGKVAASTSWYTPAGTSNDWLITPSFSVPTSGILEWEAIVSEAAFPDGYQVKISTTGTTVANFSTNLLTVAAENPTWTFRSINLNAYAGQTVNIAFVNNSNDKNRLYLDNIKVFVPQPNDGSIASITGLTRYMAGAGNQNITGSFKSFGSGAANTAVINYKVNNGATITQTVTFSSPLNYGQSTNYSFTTPANLAVGANRVKSWVTHVNGVSEINLLNDTSYSLVYVATQSATRNVLIEEWSSSTCNPCASLNSTFDPLLNTNNPNTGGDLNVIKYQVNWPSPGNDPSYNAHCLSRRAHYDVNAAPTTIIDGTSEMNNHSQAEIDAAKLLDAYADITATLTAKKTNTLASTPITISANATITPYLTIPSNSPLRVYQALVQKYYNLPGATTTQKDYYHVMRKMNPDGWGTPMNVTSGTTFTVSFNQTVTPVGNNPLPAQMSFNYWTTSGITFEYVVFVQDTISNDVIQSASWSSTVAVPAPTTTVGFKELTNNSQISIFPNPAKEFAIVSINLEKSSVVDVTIYDITGKLVYTNKGTNLDSGEHQMKINTSEFAAGNYNVVVNANGAALKEKLIISK